MARGFEDVGAMLRALKPDEPVYIFRPHELNNAASFFTSRFPGEEFYTAGANPHPLFLRTLYDGRFRNFAVNDLNELRIACKYAPQARVYAFNPVTSASMIREAIHKYGVMQFAVDHADGLAKLIVHAAPLKPTIIIRLALTKNGAMCGV